MKGPTLMGKGWEGRGGKWIKRGRHSGCNIFSIYIPDVSHCCVLIIRSGPGSNWTPPIPRVFLTSCRLSRRRIITRAPVQRGISADCSATWIPPGVRQTVRALIQPRFTDYRALIIRLGADSKPRPMSSRPVLLYILLIDKHWTDVCQSPAAV